MMSKFHTGPGMSARIMMNLISENQEGEE